MPHYYLILIGALNIFFQGTLDQGKNAGKQGNKVVEKQKRVWKKTRVLYHVRVSA